MLLTIACIKNNREAWPKVGIIIRGNSHYGCPEVMDFCNQHNLKFILGVTSYKPMTKKRF
ncbi:transposase [bacterium]|nr:transposase [bacterium]